MPRLGMRSREGSSEQQASERSGGRGREALYCREFERDRKAGRGDWLFRMQMVMTRDDDDGGPRPGWSDDDANMGAAAAVAATQAPLPNDVSLSLRRREERAIHP